LTFNKCTEDRVRGNEKIVNKKNEQII
jgi:hypothetical protein